MFGSWLTTFTFNQTSEDYDQQLSDPLAADLLLQAIAYGCHKKNWCGKRQACYN